MARLVQTMPLQSLWDFHRRGLINMDPPYQRRTVWSDEYRRDFIDTILRGYPVPEIFLYRQITASGEANYSVIDGKQRLSTVFDFANDQFAFRQSPKAKDTLLAAYNRMRFSGLPEDIRQSFWEYQWVVEFLPATEQEVIDDVFDRINRNVANLLPQELRHARYQGAFIKQVEASTQFLYDALPNGFPNITRTMYNRMKDNELVAELFLLLEEGPSQTRPEVLDEAFAVRDDTWPARDAIVARFEQVVGYLQLLLAYPEGGESLAQSRLKNVTDFYPFFGAVDDVLREQRVSLITAQVVHRLNAFVARVEAKDPKEADRDILAYATAVRGNANDATLRKKRQAWLHAVMRGDWDERLRFF